MTVFPKLNLPSVCSPYPGIETQRELRSPPSFLLHQARWIEPANADQSHQRILRLYDEERDKEAFLECALASWLFPTDSKILNLKISLCPHIPEPSIISLRELKNIHLIDDPLNCLELEQFVRVFGSYGQWALAFELIQQGKEQFLGEEETVARIQEVAEGSQIQTKSDLVAAIGRCFHGIRNQKKAEKFFFLGKEKGLFLPSPRISLEDQASMKEELNKRQEELRSIVFAQKHSDLDLSLRRPFKTVKFS